MRAIAKRFVFGVPAAAQADDRPSGESISISILVLDGKLAFDTDRSIIENCDLR